MKAKLTELERQLENDSTRSALSPDRLLTFPDYLKDVHSYKLFGANLLAIPANLIIEGDDDEFERPFSFVDSKETLQVFESEYRNKIPKDLIQIGWLYGATEVVLLNTTNETIHIFHVQDFPDTEWLEYKLQKVVCTFPIFVENLRIQTVCCFMNPENYSQWDIFEIRNGLELRTESSIESFANNELVLKVYFDLVGKSLKKGYKLHYAPQNVIQAIRDFK
jgi:hypothetical protein